MVEETQVGIWGVGRWSSAYLWGAGNPERRPPRVDRYDGRGYWRRHCWRTDFWVGW